MIGRLTAFDLPARLDRLAPRPVVQLAAGVSLACAAFGLRALLGVVVSGAAPFTLLFPAILLATGLAGWEAGLAALVAGIFFGGYFLLAPSGGLAMNGREVTNLCLYLLSGALVIAAAAAYRRTALALRDSQDRLDRATSAAHVGVWEWRLDTNAVFYSDEARRICGFAFDQPVTVEMVTATIHPDDLPVTLAQWELACDPSVRDESPYEYRVVRPDGEQRWVHVRGRGAFEPGKDGRLAVIRYVGTLQDITARKADEERLRLLAREVDHRANNLLAVVQGTVALSQADDAQALKSVITGRVNALARAHQLLAKARWEGADLRRLVEEELLVFSFGDEARVSIHGPAVALAPAAAQSVAMALHELATNAAKYGALSAPKGRVDVGWRRADDGTLMISWRETGGPAVTKPQRKGLGTTVLSRALSGPIRGRSSLDWRPEGLVCELILPPAALEPAGPDLEVSAPRVAAAEPRSRSAR